MDRIGIGLIGAGIMGDHYARVFCESRLTNLIGIADVNEKKAEKLKRKYKAKKSFADYHKLLEEPGLEAVAIATPDFLHTKPMLDCLEANKHVLVEKPLTTNLEEADQILKIAKSKKVKLMVNFSHRWVPSYYLAREYIAGGKIGEPVMGYARKNDTIYVPTRMIKWAGKSSPAMFLSAHDIDLVRWYVESEAEEVYANGIARVLKAKGINTYDCIQAQVRFKNKAVVTFESSWIYPDTFPTKTDSFVEIIGTKGVIHIDRKEEQIQIATPKSFEFPKNLITLPIFDNLRGAFSLSLNHFIECILEDREPKVTGKDGRQVTEIICAIHSSLKKGKPVKL